MMQDIVFPKNNEEKFIAMAKKLGINELVFVYPFVDFSRKKFDTKIKLKFGIIAKENEIHKAKNKADHVFYENDEKTRHVVEKFKPAAVFNLENSFKRDFVHHRNSGLNHIIAKLMYDKKVAIAFSFSEILNSKKREILLGRIAQNIRLCKKYKVKMITASFAKDPYEMRSNVELKSFFKKLGMG